VRVPFDPPPGLVTDDTIYASPGAVADINNMRWVERRPQTIGGWAKMFTTTLMGICRNVINWTNLTGARNVAFGTHQKLYVYLDGVLTDITPSGLSSGASSNGAGNRAWGTGTWGSGTWGTPLSQTRLRTWSLATWGQNLLASPRYAGLYKWTNDTGVPAALVSGAPDSITVMRVPSKRRQVVAFGTNEELSGNFNPLCIRWSDFEDETDWITLGSNNAGEYVLEGGGQIVAAEEVGDVFGVWTDNALYQMVFAGNPGETYQFDTIGRECGAIGPNAVTTLNGTAYWVGKDYQIRAWSYGTLPAIIECPIWKEFSDNLDTDQAEKLVVVSNSRFGEVWIFYPDSRDGSENSRAIFFKVTAEGFLWAKSDLSRTAFGDAGVLAYPVGVTSGGTVYNHESGTNADGSSLSWTLRSAAQYLGEAEQVLQVQRLTPDFKDQENSLTLTAYVRSRPQATPTTEGPYTVAVNAEKVDFRFSGAIAELEFAGTNYVRFGKPTFDAVGMGQR
jgi:hypothetical protein